MKTLLIGLALTLGTIAWLVISSAMGESPLDYDPSCPWYDSGRNLNTVLFHFALVFSSGVLGAGIAFKLGFHKKLLMKFD